MLQPLHLLKGDHIYLLLGTTNVLEGGRKSRKQLLLLLRQLVVRLVDREVKIRGQRRVPPRFAYLVMIAEGIVVPGKNQHNNSSQQSKNTETENRLCILGMGDLSFETGDFHYRFALKNSCIKARHSFSNTPEVTVALG